MHSTFDHPIRFEPYLRPMPWGGRSLSVLLGKHLPTVEPYGESWEVSDHLLHQSIAAAGACEGQSLRALMQEATTDLLGSKLGGLKIFPWLVKFLDAEDWLSVQVHPDEKSVAVLWPGESAKSEAWFILDAQPASRIFAGLRTGVGPTEFRAALLAGAVTECLHQFEPRPGDCLYLPAGTVHAVGGGVVLAEVQQTSDATFRLHDWDRRDSQGRPRKLHLDEGLAAIDWSQGPQTPVAVGDFKLDASRQGPELRSELLRSPYFNLEFLRAHVEFTVPRCDRVRAFMVFAGKATLSSGEELSAGQVWLLPAAMSERWCRPTPVLTGLLCTLP